MRAPLGDEIARAIEARRGALPARVLAAQMARHPELAASYDEHQRAQTLEDLDHHLDYLCDSVAIGDPDLFADYLTWADAASTEPGNARPAGTPALGMLVDELEAALPAAFAQAVDEHVRAALDRLRCAVPLGPSPSERDPVARLAARYLTSLLEGNRRGAVDLVIEAADSGVSVKDLYLRLFQPAQRELGRLWQLGRVSVAQEHFCTAATQLAMSQLYPRLFASRRNGLAVVGTCVGHELHELGLRMVVDSLGDRGLGHVLPGGERADLRGGEGSRGTKGPPAGGLRHR